MEHWNEMGFRIHLLSHRIRHMADQIAFPREGEERPAVTGIQGRIMGYLSENQDRDVFQRDIQTQFSVTRSTVTGNLQLMEKNGLITRQPVEWDARLKKIVLTPKALGMHESVMRGIRRSEELLSSTLEPEEKKEFLRLCGKIWQGLKDMDPCEKEGKEG